MRVCNALIRKGIVVVEGQRIQVGTGDALQVGQRALNNWGEAEGKMTKKNQNTRKNELKIEKLEVKVAPSITWGGRLIL